MAKDVETLTGTDATDFGAAVRKFSIPNTTIPAVADFSWVNQGAASADDVSNVGVHMHHTFATGNNLRVLVKAMPATPYTVELIYESTQYFVNYVNGGIVLRDSASGRLITAGHQAVSNVATVQSGWRWNSPTSLDSTTHFAAAGLGVPKVCGVRIADDGTNHTMSFSVDGLVWRQFGSAVSRTAWLAAQDQIGIYFENVLASGSSTTFSGGIIAKSFRTF